MKSELTEIVRICLKLEKKAIDLYQKMSDIAIEEDLKKLWQSMSAQEKTHVDFWEKLLRLVSDKKIWNIFENPGKILDELKVLDIETEKYFSDTSKLSDPAVSFLVAYRLEVIMLHPAFAAMFIMMKDLAGSSPADAYEAHIGTLLDGIKQHKMISPEFELIDDLARRLWKRNKEIAEHLAKINALHGVVPICMHCKKIRNDDGYWSNVEKYLKTGMPDTAMLSHGICPECMKKYYSEYID